MNIYAISDLHGKLPPIPQDADVLLIAGDICPDFQPRSVAGASAQAEWLNTMFRDWLSTRPDGCDVIAIWGNHDFVGEVPHYRELTNSLPWVLLQDRLYYYTKSPCRDVKFSIYGTPWVPGLPRWAFYGSDSFLEARADAIQDCDILMVHGPPYGAGDYIPGSEKQASKYGNIHGLNVGDPALTDKLKSADAPHLLICGHIHEDRGVHRIANTEVLNVAAVDGDYELHENPWTRIYL